MIVLNVMIAASWLIVIVDSVLQGFEFPLLLATYALPNVPLWLMTTGTILIPLVISALTFWRRENVMEHIPKVTDWIDRWVFEGAYQYFMNRMYPVHASMVSSALFAGAAGWVTYRAAANEVWRLWSYAICGGCIVFVLAMWIAVAASRRYPPLLK